MLPDHILSESHQQLSADEPAEGLLSINIIIPPHQGVHPTQLFDAYTTLQQKLQQYERTGRLAPHPEATRPRFLAFAEADLMPLTRRLATILCQAGIPAQASAELEGDSLWFGLFLDDRWSMGVYLQPFDEISMRLTLRFSWEPTIEEHHALLYRTCTRVTFAAALERGIERLLMQSWQSDVPCHLHLI